MLKRFRSPRWQHPDVEVRRQAIQSLAWDADREIIVSVAREDTEPSLRKLALRQALDLDLLAKRGREDTDASVREQAQRRYREVFAGKEDGGPALEQRIARLADIDEQALLEYLAREGAEEELRRRCLTRIERENVLRDVALDDPSAELRLEALAMISDESMLRRVYERSRKSDKRVSHAARDRLDAIRAEHERPQRVAAECEQICTSLEHLGKGDDWQRDEDVAQRMAERWNALDAEHRSPFEDRYRAAHEHFQSALASVRTRHDPLRAAKAQILDRLRAQNAPTQDSDERETLRWCDECELLLAGARTDWNAIEPLADAEERQLDEQFQHLSGQLDGAIRTVRERHALNELLARHDALLSSKRVIPEPEIKALERAIATVPTGNTSDTLRALARRLDKAHTRLRERVREQAEWKEATLAALPQRLDALGEALGSGRSSDAIEAHDGILADLEALGDVGASRKRLQGFRKRLGSLSKEVQVLRAWGRYGTHQAQLQLCERMEELKGSQLHPGEIARQVREARDEWKALARKNDGGANRTLWQRFDAAASEAYLPCKAYYEERASARKQNAERRRALLAELDDFLATTSGGPDTDWKEATRFRRDLLKRWHEAHPVEGKETKALAKALDARLPGLDALLARERERSKAHREGLIAEATALAEDADKRRAAEACKQLQRQWQVTVPGKRGEEQALWTRFRSACDAVFSNRQQVLDDARASAKASAVAREQLCARAEALLETGADALEEAERELHRIERDWERSEAAPRQRAQALQTRFTRAKRAFEKRRRELRAAHEHEMMARAYAKSRLCHEAELMSFVGDDPSTPDDTVSRLRARWTDLDPLDDATLEDDLTTRFEHALERMGRAPDSVSMQSLAENLELRESLCLRMEIAAGIESPPEFAQARMAAQVSRLAAAFGDTKEPREDTPRELLRAWCICGPAPSARAAGLEARFERAWRAHRDIATAPDA